MKNEKNSLEELKARSEQHKYFLYPNLITVAKKAKSPNAAFELAIRQGYRKEHAQACRYLAMIKRDYGNSEFNSFIKELKMEGFKVAYYAVLRPAIQLASRLDYLQKTTEERIIIFTKHEQVDYLKILRNATSIFTGNEFTPVEKLEKKYPFPIPIDEKSKIPPIKTKSEFLEQTLLFMEHLETNSRADHNIIWGTVCFLKDYTKAFAPLCGLLPNSIYLEVLDRIHN